jgi:hypothetical protein
MSFASRACACLFACLMTTGVMAGPYEDGVAAYDRQDFATALKLWLPLAEQGNSAAQFNVAVLLEKGLGVARDVATAARWYRMAAEQGDPEAQYDIAVLYETGSGVPKDAEAARKWFGAAIANPRTDAATAAVKERARARLAKLVNPTEQAIPYDGGRFVIARAADGTCVVALQGAVTRDAAWTFDEVIQQGTQLGCANPWVLLESPGGALEDGLALGTHIRRAGYRTITRFSCASVCAMIFLSGTERVLVGSRARIGLHQPAQVSSSRRRCDTAPSGTAGREISRYLKAMTPAHADEIFKLAMDTSCDDILWIQGQRALDLALATKLEAEGVDLFGKAAGTASKQR